MYSGVPYIVDLYNDTDEIKASLVSQEEDGAYIQLKCHVKKALGPDSTGVMYVHITDGVQHMRLPIQVEVPEKGKKK
jgi:hypothetical protein